MRARWLNASTTMASNVKGTRIRRKKVSHPRRIEVYEDHLLVKGIFQSWKVFLDDIRMIRVCLHEWDLFGDSVVSVRALINFDFWTSSYPEVTKKLDFDGLFGSDWYYRAERGEVLEARLATKDAYGCAGEAQSGMRF